MGLVKQFTAALVLAGGAVSALAQACVVVNDKTTCVDSGSISSDRAFPPGAYTSENGRRVPLRPSPHGYDPRVKNNSSPTSDRVVPRFSVIVFEHEKGNIYCDPMILNDSRPRNTQSLCVDFSNALGDGAPIEPLRNPFVRRVEVDQNRTAFCRSDSKFGQPGKTTSLKAYAIYPAGVPIDCIVFGHNQ